MRLKPIVEILVIATASVFVSTCTEPPSAPTKADNLTIRASGSTTPKLNSIVLSPLRDTIEVGQTLQLSATVTPNVPVTLTWTSSKVAVATVDQNGLVTAVAKGSATISAKASGKTGKSTILVVPATAPPGSVTFVGAGDIASCSSTGDEATAKLLDVIPGTIFLLGDNVYENGTAAEFANCYNPSWGRHKARTMPAPGNHDYNTANGAGYYGYFGAAAHGPNGYYSYDLGDWHIIALNSNLGRDSLSTQGQWLKADLAAHPNSCTLAYWHHPRFSSGLEHGNDASVQDLWKILYDANADVILNGHDHDYERFAPQTATGVLDTSRGIREFVVGTGGRSHYGLGTRKANSEVFDGKTYGVLKMYLSAGSYIWEFVPVAGASFTDAGRANCH